MNYSKQRWEEKPVAVEKSKLGRELATVKLPVDSSRTASSKHLEKDEGSQGIAKRGGEAEAYHEGWMNGKLYLIPDSNLEIMKDLVNLKLRRRGDSAFVRDDYGTEKQETKDKYWERLRKMSTKLNDLEDAEILVKKDEFKKDKGSPPWKRKLSTDTEKGPFRIVPFEVKTRRFLVSGHIGSDSSPVFIIHRYVGKSPFWRKEIDFTKIESSDQVDFLISGKFFEKNILEEKNCVYKAMNIAPYLKIPIDDRCRIHRKKFSEVLKSTAVDIRVEGNFFEGERGKSHTPFLSFVVHKRHSIEFAGKCGRKCKECLKKTPLFVRKNIKKLFKTETTVNFCQVVPNLTSEVGGENELNLKIKSERNDIREQIYCETCLKEILEEDLTTDEDAGEDEHFLNLSRTRLIDDQQTEQESNITKLPKEFQEVSHFTDQNQSTASLTGIMVDKTHVAHENNQKLDNFQNKTLSFGDNNTGKGCSELNFECERGDFSTQHRGLPDELNLQKTKGDQGDLQNYSLDLEHLEYRCQVRPRKKRSQLQNICRAIGGMKSTQKTICSEKQTPNTCCTNTCLEEEVVTPRISEYRCIVRPKRPKPQKPSVFDKISGLFS